MDGRGRWASRLWHTTVTTDRPLLALVPECHWLTLIAQEMNNNVDDENDPIDVSRPPGRWQENERVVTMGLTSHCNSPGAVTIVFCEALRKTGWWSYMGELSSLSPNTGVNGKSCLLFCLLMYPPLLLGRVTTIIPAKSFVCSHYNMNYYKHFLLRYRLLCLNNNFFLKT